ncbi:MAG: O-antigen ligase family protein [Desulfobacteraceae bacterium]|jgi:hypothetical protein
MPSPESIRLILTIFALCSFVGMLKRPFWGVVSYLMIMMLRPGLYYPTLATYRIEMLVGVLVILFIFVSGKISRMDYTEDMVIKWMCILFGVMTLSMVQAMDFSVSWNWMNDFLKIFLFFIMVVCLTDSVQDCEVLLIVFCMLTSIIAYEAIFNYMSGNLVESMDESSRMTYAVADSGMGSGHVALANMCNQALAVAWYVGACHRNKIIKLFGFVLFIVLLAGVVVSGSKGGFFGLATFFVCWIVFADNKLKMVFYELVAIAVIVIINPDYLSFMKSVKVVGSTDSSANSRISGLSHGFQMLLNRPILGVGPGCYPVARRAWFGWGLWAHNLYGELMGDLGVLGVIASYKFLKNYVLKAHTLMKKYTDDPMVGNICKAVLVATIVRLVLGMGSHSLYIFFWYFLAGVVVVITRNFQTTP